MNAVIYKIEYWALGKLTAMIEKYNRRSAKLGVPPLKFSVQTVEKIVKGEEVKYLEVSFEGDPAKINGWEFIGTLQHAEGVNILRSVPGKEIPETFRTHKPHCEHCAKYRTRKDTFVLHKMSTETIPGVEPLNVYKQVGRNCLRDFLGHDPSTALALMDMIRELGQSSEGSSGPLMVQPLELVQMAAAVANKIGFSRDSAQEAWNYLFPSKELRQLVRKGKAANIKVDEAAKELAQRALAWLETATMNSFLSNVKAAASLPYISRREATLASWVIGAYLKEKEQEKLAQTKAQLRREKMLEEKELFGRSVHFGTVGERLEMNLTLLMERNIGADAMGATLVLYKFLTDAGNIVTWITATSLDVEVGKSFKAKATIKQHREYQGIPETAVNRLAVSKRDEETVAVS